jgi:hypothetical protein
MKSLNEKAWVALVVLVMVMALLLFVPAWTVRYGQAWVYLSIFAGASLVTTLYLMEDPALRERRVSGGPTAEKRPPRSSSCSARHSASSPFLSCPRLTVASGGPPCHSAAS